MSTPEALRALADFCADHPDLPAPSVLFVADASWESDAAPRQVAAFLDGMDDLDLFDNGATSVRVSRSFGDVDAAIVCPRSVVTLIEPQPVAPVYATVEQIRRRAGAPGPKDAA